MVWNMVVTNDNIRDLLNRPRGLTEATITEYVTIRTAQVNKVVRSSTLFGAASDNTPTTTLTDSAIKMMVCVDCLNVLIDTVPMYYPEKEQGANDQRYRDQLARFQKQANEALALVSEKGGAAFYKKSTSTRLEE